MKIGGLDFPRPILDALRDDKLVVFAGAGVSMGKPASLPSFKKLAMAIARGTGEESKENEPEDRFLGRLEHKGVEVHKIAVGELKKNRYGKIPKPTDLHRDLLRLYTTRGSPRIVTTNFDLLFETGAKGLFKSEPEIYKAPTLPMGRECDGIVHVHGTLDRPNGMVLTDKDFGRAYLTDGWALRFLVELFQSFTVLFVGYSHSDTIMNYLARALPVEQAESRFALASDDDDSQWQFLGIKPIRYTQSPHDKHCALYAGVSGLADCASRSILDWQREITEIAEKPPPLVEEEIDLIEEALRDATKTRFFIAAANSIEWVDWLDKRHHLANLFGSSNLSERDVLLVEWLAKKFTRRHPEELFLLIGRRHMRLHPKFWDALCQSISSNDETPCDADTLSRWVSLILVTAPAQSDKVYLLSRLGKHCVKNELLDRVVDVFDAMAASQLMVKRGFSWPDAEEEEQGPPLDVECAPVDNHYAINELWTSGLKPNLDRIAEPLLATVIGCLTAQHRTLSAWQVAARDWCPVSYDRSAIEPHEQDEEYHRAVDVLIDSARDSLEWLASNQPGKAVHWCDRLAGEESPLLRRLAVHTLSIRNDLNANEKIGWLLACMDLYDHTAHHELFVFLRKTYPKADQQHRMAVINAVQAYRTPEQKDKDTETITAYRHFTWLDWLHKSAPDCSLATEALNDVLSRYPEFQPSDRPDLTHWTSSVHGGHQSPWTVDELLSKSAEEWAEKLLLFQDSGIHELDRLGLNFAVSDAAKKDFNWGLHLADALAAKGAWETDLWDTLIQGWSESVLDQAGTCEVLKRLERNELHEKNSRPIAEFLFKGVKDDGPIHTYALIPDANNIAASLWNQVDSNESPPVDFKRWLTKAINHTAGILANYWLHCIQCWRSQQNPKPQSLNKDYNAALTTIVRDDTVAGRLGRSVLAGNLTFLIGVDREWTQTHLIPLLTKNHQSEDYQAVWDGFLQGRLCPVVAELAGGAFLDAVSRIESEFIGEGQKLFVQRFVDMISNFVESPFDVWIPRFFDYAHECARHAFALHIGVRLSEMAGVQQQEWWERWLRQYWANRLNGVPKGLNGVEVESMLRWLPNLEPVFAEAVELAVRMPTENAKHSVELLYRIRKGDLCESHPESVAKLLLYLEGINSESYARTEERELIGILREADIPSELRLKLEELAARRGIA